MATVTRTSTIGSVYQLMLVIVMKIWAADEANYRASRTGAIHSLGRS